MNRVLVTWVGRTDLRALAEEVTVGLGPIAQAVRAQDFDQVILLHDYAADEVQPYADWLSSHTSAPLTLRHEPLSGPTHFGEIYQAAVRTIEHALESAGDSCELVIHLSPGTPAMAAVWILLAKTRFPATLIESSRQHGVREATVPFDIAVDFLPDLFRGPDERIERLARGLPPNAPEFEAILHQSQVMRRAVTRARKVALRSVPVLIEGESGTGKELFARAIHQASPRKSGPFIAVNCGAISPELVESELFGHEKGAFTGANKQRKGYFEAAHGGTLFLDEIGDLPAPAQVKLLRVLQEREIVRVGATSPVQVDVRIIAATHRTITDEIAAGRFREDLFYRLAVAILKLPPLRERHGDLGLLIDALLGQVNQESESDPGYQHKTLSASARNLLLQHPWPGNVRELLNTLRRAAIWCGDEVIRGEDIRDALLPPRPIAATGILNKPLGDGLDVQELLVTVA
ncbi:MAG: AAA domain-containing protein, partial [Oligoflexia bacterium]|nr:AAA domain-containing protein [Oligoflexia bacterium]